jgi:hypothetical protein
MLHFQLFHANIKISIICSKAPSSTSFLCSQQSSVPEPILRLLRKVLPSLNSTCTRRTSGHRLGTFSAKRAFYPLPPFKNVVSLAIPLTFSFLSFLRPHFPTWFGLGRKTALCTNVATDHNSLHINIWRWRQGESPNRGKWMLHRQGWSPIKASLYHHCLQTDSEA